MAPGLDPTSMVATTPLFHLAALGVSQLGGFEKLSRVTGKALLEVSLLSSMPQQTTSVLTATSFP